MLTPRMQRLQDKIQRTFADDTLYVYCRPTGIIEVRKKTFTQMKNDLIIKRWQKWTPNDRILYELWERDTWGRADRYSAIDDAVRLRKMKTVSDTREQERLKKMVRKQEGKHI